MNLLVIGVGNPILGDDAAGIHVARAIKKQLPPRLLVDVKEGFTGGIDLAEELLGYDRVILVDTITGIGKPGVIKKLGINNLDSTRHTSSPHGLNLASALEILRRYSPDSIPRDILIIGISVNDEITITEQLSKTIKKAIDKTISLIMEEIKKPL